MVAVLTIFRIAVFMRTDVLPLFYYGFPRVFFYKGIGDVWWVFLVWLFFLYYEGMYTKRFSFWDEIEALWKVSFFSTVGVFTVSSIGKLGEDMSRTVVVVMGVVSLIVFPLIRTISKKVLRRFGLLKRRVLILGAGETGKLIVRALKKEPNYGYEILGFVDDDPKKYGMRIDGIKVHRGIDRAAEYVKGCNIEDLFIAMPGAGKERLQGLINGLQHKVERILFVPDIFGIAVTGTNLQHFFHEEAFAFEMKNNLSNPLNIFIKRCFDMIMSVLMLPLLSIPMAVIAALIRLDSKGQAFFSQERIGKKGLSFNCYKFRTMYEDAEDSLTGLLDGDPEAQREWDTHWKLSEDPRVTRVGRFLRSTSLDELPQVFNVLKGQMSLVGPRPYLPREKQEMGDRDYTILLTKPGITGLWQVSGRSNTSYDYRMSLDSWYVRNWNLWLDIVILLKTVRIVIKREGAY
ncbi:MAG: undecaprenyl-phosphate galactose phosphotransferase WbaP [Thermodesulfovibrionales bacterium]